jgi:hypothetical protein
MIRQVDWTASSGGNRNRNNWKHVIKAIEGSTERRYCRLSFHRERREKRVK